MLIIPEITLAVLLFVAGSCIFSFLNVVIYRLPRGISFVKGFSMCTTCGHRLSGLDMVPVLSWLFLRGKCRYCGAPVSGRYTLVEAIGGVTALLCVWQQGFSIGALLLFLFFCFLTVVAFIDWDTMEIPNGLVAGILALALIHTVITEPFSWKECLLGFFSVSLPLFAIAAVIPGAFGGGDIKLMAACGLYLGWRITLLSFFFAVLGGGGYGIYLLLTRKKEKKDHFPFGPFLCAGMAIGQFAGMRLLDWYLGFFL